MPQIKELLQELNPWWKGTFNLVYKKREVYEKIQKFLPTSQILAFVGLRRVGKTTLMLKIAEDAIKRGHDPKNILYFSFDELKEIEIREVIKAYEELLGNSVKNGKYIFLLDEIQKLNNWEGQLKTIYDMHKQNIKLIISGSESLFIRKKTKETLAGRIFEFKVSPLTFREFIGFIGAKLNPVDLYKQEYKRLFNDYMFTYGFPELIDIKDKEIIKKYIKDGIIEKVLYRDIPTLFRIKNVSILESVLNIFMENPGQITELVGLSKELKISRRSLANYLYYLEKSFLIKKLYNFSKNRRKVERKLKKYYPAMVSPDLLFRNDTLSISKVFEWSIITQLNAEFFWRDQYKNEVDAILTEGKSIPVEIKYGKLDVKNITAFMRLFNIKTGYIVSNDIEEKISVDDKVVFVVPAFKLLLDKDF